MTTMDIAAALRADPAATLDALEICKFAGHRASTPFAVSARLSLTQEWDRTVASVHYLGDGKGGYAKPESYIGYGPWPEVPTTASRAEEIALRQGRESSTGTDLEGVCDRTDAAWVAAGGACPPPEPEEIAVRKAKAWIRELREGTPKILAETIAAYKAKLTDERSMEQLNYRIFIAYLKNPW